MSEKVRKTIVYTIFVLACIWGYATFSGKKASSPKPPKTIAPISAASVGRTAASSISLKRDSLVAAYAARAWGKNPFYHSYQPVRQTAPVEKVRLHLLGIIYKPAGGHALINNRMVAEGDEVAGYRVVKIAKDRVVVDKQGDTKTLRLTKESS